MKKGKIELTPRSKKGNVFMLCEGEYTYPDDEVILTETFEQLLDRCIPEGSESYHARGLVHSIEVVNVPESVTARKLFSDGTVKEFANKEISYEELYRMYKASIEELKSMSEELAKLKDAMSLKDPSLAIDTSNPTISHIAGDNEVSCISYIDTYVDKAPFLAEVEEEIGAKLDINDVIHGYSIYSAGRLYFTDDFCNYRIPSTPFSYSKCTYIEY